MDGWRDGGESRGDDASRLDPTRAKKTSRKLS